MLFRSRPAPPRPAPPRPAMSANIAPHSDTREPPLPRSADALRPPSLPPSSPTSQAISSEIKVFEEVLGAFKDSYEKHKTPESFKLAWPGLEASAKDFLNAVDTYHEHLRAWLPKVVDGLTAEQRAELVDSMKAKRAAIAASKIQGPDAIDMRAIKKAQKAAEKAAKAAEEAEEAGGGGGGASKKAAKKAAKKGGDDAGAEAAAKPAAAAAAAPAAKGKKAKEPVSVSSTPQMPVASPSSAMGKAGAADPVVLHI